MLTVGFAAVCFQPLYDPGRLRRLERAGPYRAASCSSCSCLTALCDAVLAAALARARTGWPFGPLLRDELRALLGIGSASAPPGR